MKLSENHITKKTYMILQQHGLLIKLYATTNYRSRCFGMERK